MFLHRLQKEDLSADVWYRSTASSEKHHTCRPKQQDIALLQLDLIITLAAEQACLCTAVL